MGEHPEPGRTSARRAPPVATLLGESANLTSTPLRASTVRKGAAGPGLPEAAAQCREPPAGIDPRPRSSQQPTLRVRRFAFRPQQRLRQRRLALVEALGVEGLRQLEELVVEVMAELVDQRAQERPERDDVPAVAAVRIQTRDPRGRGRPRPARTGRAARRRRRRGAWRARGRGSAARGSRRRARRSDRWHADCTPARSSRARPPRCAATCGADDDARAGSVERLDRVALPVDALARGGEAGVVGEGHGRAGRRHGQVHRRHVAEVSDGGARTLKRQGPHRGPLHGIGADRAVRRRYAFLIFSSILKMPFGEPTNRRL